MKLILTNDDGIGAPGLLALTRVVQHFGEPIVFAPHCERSGCSHTATTDRPFRVEPHSRGRYSVEGTPADCVRIGMFRHQGELSWAIAGINNGGNLGMDVYLSGTVAAVREAVIHGLPGIAISQYRNRELTEEEWERTAENARRALAEVIQQPWAPGTMWNINLPIADGNRAPELVYCPLDPSPLPLSFAEQNGEVRYNGRYHERARRPGSDIDVCFGGNIAVTRMFVVEPSR